LGLTATERVDSALTSRNRILSDDFGNLCSLMHWISENKKICIIITRIFVDAYIFFLSTNQILSLLNGITV
jgi:hypothetical protein